MSVGAWLLASASQGGLPQNPAWHVSCQRLTQHYLLRPDKILFYTLTNKALNSLRNTVEVKVGIQYLLFRERLCTDFLDDCPDISSHHELFYGGPDLLRSVRYMFVPQMSVARRGTQTTMSEEPPNHR